MSDGLPYLVECAGRFAGDGIIELIDRAYPADLAGAYWTLMKGEPLAAPLPQRAEAAAAIRFLHVEPGEVQSVDGLDEAGTVPGVTSCAVTVRPGDQTRELRNSWDRVGSAIACAPTAAEAMRRATEAVGHIQIKVLPTRSVVSCTP
jgi:biotin carboxylase